jgi:hypothetical protein
LSRPLSSICFWSNFRITFSNSFPVVERRLIGRKFWGNLGSTPRQTDWLSVEMWLWLWPRGVSLTERVCLSATEGVWPSVWLSPKEFGCLSDCGRFPQASGPVIVQCVSTSPIDSLRSVVWCPGFCPSHYLHKEVKSTHLISLRMLGHNEITCHYRVLRISEFWWRLNKSKLKRY